MYKTTDVKSLGTEYNVSDENGNFIKSIQIIPHQDILNVAVGEYSDKFKSIKEYLTKSIEVLSGYENIDPNKIYWLATGKTEVVLTELVQHALSNGYEIIILEHLENLEN